MVLKEICGRRGLAGMDDSDVCDMIYLNWKNHLKLNQPRG